MLQIYTWQVRVNGLCVYVHILYIYTHGQDFPGGSVVFKKNPPAKQETRVQSLGQEDPLEKEMAPCSGTLAWKIPWMEEPGRLWSMGSLRVGLD